MELPLIVTQAYWGWETHKDPRAHFGLGGNATADLEICWPSGYVDRIAGVKANQVLVVKEGV